MSRAEFGIAALRGYRKWDIRGGRLVSCYNQVWPLRAPARLLRALLRAGLPIPSGTRHGHFAGQGCGLYAWSAPELVERRTRCWAGVSGAGEVVEGWGRVVEHEQGFRALYMRPLALSPCSRPTSSSWRTWPPPTRSGCLMSVGEVRRAFPPLTSAALAMTQRLDPAASSSPHGGGVGTVIRVSRFLHGDGLGDCKYVRLYPGGNQFAGAQPGCANCRATPPPRQTER